MNLVDLVVTMMILFGAVTLTKMLILISMGILDLMKDQVFHFQVVDLVRIRVFKSFSAHIDNKKKDILALRKEPTQGLEHTLTAQKMHSINFTVTRKKFCLSLHYN